MISRYLLGLFSRLAGRLPRPEPASRMPASATTGAQLNSALRIAGLGCWTWNLRSGALALAPEADRILAQPELDGTFSTWVRFLDPADFSAMQVLEDRVRRGQRTFSFEYRFRGGDGRLRRIKSDGEVVSLDEQGMPLTLAGTLFALDDAHRAGARRPLPPGDAAHAWSWEQDASYRFTALADGQPAPVPGADQALGCRRWELPHAVPLHSTWQEHLAVLERREPFRGFEYRVGQEPDASYVSTSGDPLFGPKGEFRGYRGTAHSITPRARAQEEARHARLFLEQASRLGQVGAWALRVPDMEAEWTPESERLLRPSGSGPLSWQEALARLEPPYRSELEQAVADCVALGCCFSMEARSLDADGSVRWLRILGEPEPSVIGPCRRVIGVVKDISRRKQDARRLQELNEQLVTTFESITEGFYTIDRQWRFTYANHEMERVAQRPRAELLGGSVLDLFDWFPGSRMHQEYARALADGRPKHFEMYLQALDVWVEVHVYPSSLGLAVYFQDITERKDAEGALQASEERHRLLVDVSMDAIFQLEHASGKILSVNPAGCRMLGLSEAEILERGRRGLVAIHEERLEQLLAEAGREGRSRGRLKLVRGDGTEFEAELSGALFTTGDGVVYASVVVRDVSELVKYQAEILALNDSLAQKVRDRTAELETANTELKAFAHSLAHDLRTPIAAINALSHALEQRLAPAAERERHYAARIRLAGEQLDDYVEALLSHARISQAPMREARIDLSAAAEGILDDLRLREPTRAVATYVQSGLSAIGDPALLRMALENLLGNAWKFTGHRPDAEIRFDAERQADGSTAFRVHDNGAGFDMDYAHKLFGAFQRLHTQSEFPGTGIGLAHVERIVARHGGRVWAAGQPGVGASFWFTLPQEAPSADRDD